MSRREEWDFIILFDLIVSGGIRHHSSGEMLLVAEGSIPNWMIWFRDIWPIGFTTNSSIPDWRWESFYFLQMFFAKHVSLVPPLEPCVSRFTFLHLNILIYKISLTKTIIMKLCSSAVPQHLVQGQGGGHWIGKALASTRDLTSSSAE